MSNRYSKKRVKERYAPKVEKIEISEKYFKPRLIAAIALLLIGGLTIGFAVKNLVNTDPGWQEIEINKTEISGCSGDFTFMYELGRGELSATAESRALSAIYTDACIDAANYFTADEAGSKYSNLYDLNEKPNTWLEVSEELYDALKLMEDANSRYLYLAPVYSSYSNLYNSQSDAEAKAVDPYYDESYSTYFAQVAAFASDPEAVSLELGKDNQVRLVISDDYQKFAEAEGIEKYVDFGHMRNAFICDYLAETIISEGYTLGCIASYDGYTRYLDDGDMTFNYTVFERKGSQAIEVAQGSLSGMKSSIVLKDFQTTALDQYRYYTYDDCTVRSPYISLEDGLDHASISYLFGSSDKKGCAEVLLNLLPEYTKAEFDEEAVLALKSKGVYVTYSKNGNVNTNIPNTEFETGNEQ